MNELPNENTTTTITTQKLVALDSLALYMNDNSNSMYIIHMACRAITTTKKHLLVIDDAYKWSIY